MAKTAIRPGCHRVGVDSRELLRGGYIAQARGLVRHGGVPRPGQMPPSENENEPINTANEPNSVPYPLQRNFVA